MHILFISELLPIDTYASEAVFYRHLIRLANEGHQIHIVTDEHSFSRRKKEIESAFYVHIIPNRKWYYPPFKTYGILQILRFNIYYYFFIKDILKKYKIEKLIGFIHGNFLLALTAFIQVKTALPLVSFFHDDTRDLNFNKDSYSIVRNTNKILKASNYVFIASENFKEKWNQYAAKFILLYPIAENGLNIHGVNRQSKLSIGYSGTLYNEIIGTVDKFLRAIISLQIGVTIISNNNEALYLNDKYGKLTFLPLFNTAKEANLYLLENCKYGIIIYPENIIEMPWISTCFPSKFIQNCTIGIPTIIIAPENSAIGKWCIENNWILYLNNYTEVAINAMLTTTIISYEAEIIDQTNYFAQHMFSSSQAHTLFKKYLFEH